MKDIQLIPFIAILTCFCSCDVPKMLLCNGKEKHVIQTECGTIDISSSWFSTTTIKIVFNGKYKVLLDSIKIIGSTQKYDYQDELFCSLYKEEYESVEIVHTDTALNISNGNVLTYSTKERPPYEDVIPQLYELEDKYLTLQNAIYCNSKAVPIEPIKLEGLFSREKRKKW